jgi:hypothetical protein
LMKFVSSKMGTFHLHILIDSQSSKEGSLS